ncbi:hypothetical protein CYMTET_5603, partial [Cymbomonas tetramitiformis]
MRRSRSRLPSASSTVPQAFLQVLAHARHELKSGIASRAGTATLFAQLCLFAFYFTVLNLQWAREPGLELQSVHSSVLHPRGTEFFPWLKTQILEVWTDPICGNGRCETPYEYPSYGRFGCEYDCGKENATYSILVKIKVDFSAYSSDYNINNQLREVAAWNLCHTLPHTPHIPLCWHTNDQRFKTLIATQFLPYQLPKAKWFVRVTNDHAGRVTGAVLDASNSSNPQEMPISPLWSASCLDEVSADNVHRARLQDRLRKTRKLHSVIASTPSTDNALELEAAMFADIAGDSASDARRHHGRALHQMIVA